MNTELSERFLTAFCSLEYQLQQITGIGSHESFSFLIDHVSRTNAAFAHYRDDLKEYAELRNAIVHKRIGGKTIAEPHPDVVERIESIVKIVTQTPKLAEFFSKKVTICNTEDTLKYVLDLLLKGRFNQLPVYSGKKLVGLLTSDAIVLWLANEFQTAQSFDSTSKVKELLEFASSKAKSDEYLLMGHDSTIFDALDAFDAAYKRGKHLQALIITESGKAEQYPLGIVTTLEVPRLITLVNPEPTSPVRHRS